jgi:hypothetical protein
MIEATAQENQRALDDRRAPQNKGATGLLPGTADAGNGLGTHPRRNRHLILCIAGLVVAATVGSFIFASKVTERQPSAEAADGAIERKSTAVGSANTTDEPVTRPLPSEGPDGSGAVRVEEKRTDETGGVVAAPSDDRTVATPLAGQRTEKLGSDAEPRLAEDAAEARAPAEVLPSDPIAAGDIASEEPRPPQAPSSAQPASETGSTIDRTREHPVAIRMAPTISDVRMRAGPGNGQPVLATIPRGRPVEVIECRQWCEVIFAGQRGWVYKTFIGASPIPREP